jgi:plastocyanin
MVALAGLVALPTLTLGAVAAAPAGQAFAPRELTLLVGAGQDTVSLDSFFPQTVRVRAGDTITWQVNNDRTHSVSFTTGFTPSSGPRPDPLRAPGTLVPQPNMNVPNPAGGPALSVLNPQVLFPTRAPDAPVETYSGTGFVSSGRLRNIEIFPGGPVNERYSLTFDTPGTYPYLCLLHVDEFMIGTVEVAPATAVEVPDQAEIDAVAQSEISDLMAKLEVARGQGRTARSEPGPNNTSFWYVRAGNTQFQIGDNRVQLLEYLPRDVTIRAGDTVIWGVNTPHTVTLVPSPPVPGLLRPEAQPDGSVRVVRNQQVLAPSKPSAVFDPTQYFNSGVMGPLTPAGTMWALTFDRPGTYEYLCVLHHELGMRGTVTVVAR